MGFGGISMWQLLIVLLIILLIFGTKKLRNTGDDLGAAVGNFKRSLKNDQDGADKEKNPLDSSNNNSQFTQNGADDNPAA